MDPHCDFQTTAFKSIVGKPVEIDVQINDLIVQGYALKGSPRLLPDGDLVAMLVKREKIPVEKAIERYTPPVKPHARFQGRDFGADGRGNR